jgi:hypothetical protein
MASPSFAPEPLSQKRLSLAEIDAVVAAKLGATRTLGNAQPALFQPAGGDVFGRTSRSLEHDCDRPFL